MSIIIRAHFDGKAIIPDEPVDLPIGEQLEARLTPIVGEHREADLKERQSAWERLKSRGVHGVDVPSEALRRENMYEDRICGGKQ